MGIKEYLKLMVERKGSDLFLRPGGCAHIRVHGKVLCAGEETITAHDVINAVDDLASPEQKEFFLKNLDVDFAWFSNELGRRFRVSVFMQRNNPSIVVRNINPVIESLEALNLPAAVIKKLANENRGIILLTGTMGSGKSTTIASMIEYINMISYKHILTLEEPIEFTFKDKNCIINQREIGKDVMSYPIALRAFTLQSPDVMYIANIRDLETISAALTSAETGVLVLSTLHTVNAPQTVERMINFFPPHQHHQIRTQLSTLLKGVISLRLVPLKDGSGRIPAYEIMLLTPTISRLIREGKVWEMRQYLEEGEIFGMQTFDQCLVKLTQEGKITEEDALHFADNRDEFLLSLKGFKKT